MAQTKSIPRPTLGEAASVFRGDQVFLTKDWLQEYEKLRLETEPSLARYFRVEGAQVFTEPFVPSRTMRGEDLEPDGLWVGYCSGRKNSGVRLIYTRKKTWLLHTFALDKNSRPTGEEYVSVEVEDGPVYRGTEDMVMMGETTPEGADEADTIEIVTPIEAELILIRMGFNLDFPPFNQMKFEVAPGSPYPGTREEMMRPLSSVPLEV